MKKENNLIPTHSEIYTDSNGLKLELKLAIDSKHELVEGIYFTGDLVIKHQKQIDFLCEHFQNISMQNFNQFFDQYQIDLNLPAMMLINFIRDYFGIYSLKERNDVICSCFGLTQKDLAAKFSNDQFKSYGEIVADTKASVGCGSCAKILKREYVKIVSNCFKGKINQQHFNEAGEWLHFKNLSYGKTLILIDDQIKNWLKSQTLPQDSIEIVNSQGYQITISVKNILEPKIELILEELILDRLGLLVFFQK